MDSTSTVVVRGDSSRRTPIPPSTLGLHTPRSLPRPLPNRVGPDVPSPSQLNRRSGCAQRYDMTPRPSGTAPSNLRLHSPGGVLLTFLFHGVFANEQEIEQQAVDPQQRITVDHFREFVEHMLEAGYEF